MKNNIGKVSRAAHILIGLLVLGVGAAYQSWWCVAGAVPLIVGIFGLCPFDSSCGSCCDEPKDENKKECGGCS